MAAFSAHIKTATIQRPIFAAADLENHLRANQASDPDPARFGRSRFIGLRRIFFPSGAQGWLLRGQAS
jgi:hypothetical protein